MTDSGHIHAVLIGIDAYASAPLRGCVNDIDAVQRLLVERAGVASESICRLTSAHAADAHATDVSSREATLENIRAALASLASDRVAPGDRVFVYYSGHGVRVTGGVAGRRVCREALVPVDVDAESASGPKLLFDFELNAALRAITRRTSNVTVILDCCHAGGAFRETGTFRSIELAHAFQFDETDLRTAGSRGIGAAGSVGRCTIVAACQADERAKELEFEPGRRRHGVLTKGLVARLSEVPIERLHKVTWGQIWRPLLAYSQSVSVAQNPLLVAGWQRPVLGGADRDGDIGVSIDALPNGRFRAGIGTLAGVREGALLAVYGPEPARFPALGTDADRDARLGTIQVVEATPTNAIASSTGNVFVLVEGARARVTELPVLERLSVGAIDCPPSVTSELMRSPLVRRIDSASTTERVDLTVTYRAGRYEVHGDVHMPENGRPLYSFKASDPRLVRALMEHCARHRLPLRIAGRSSDLPGALTVSVLDCADPAAFSLAFKNAPMDPDLDEVLPGDGQTYALRGGQECCFRVDNRSDVELAVALMNCAATGRVQHFGYQRVPARGRQIFWNDSNIGEPFVADGVIGSIDRLVAIGTTTKGHTWEELIVEESFDEVVERHRAFRGDATRAERPFGGRVSKPLPPDAWAAHAIAVVFAQ